MPVTIYGLDVNECMRYPRCGAPFRPAEAYPEHPSSALMSDNSVYKGVRELFRLSGLDEGNCGTPGLNPLGAYVRPGDRVLVKPSLVMDVNPSGNGTNCLYARPSAIVTVVDYVCVALDGTGEVVIAHAPMQSCDFERLVEQSGLAELVVWYSAQGVDAVLKGLRDLRSGETSGGFELQIVESARGRVINLGQENSFCGFPSGRIGALRIANYDPRELRSHHGSTQHEYCVAVELLEADVIVNLPRAKTHRKVGVAGALKNMVGVNARKEYLPHRPAGSTAKGRDEHEKSSCSERERKASRRGEQSLGHGRRPPQRHARAQGRNDRCREAREPKECAPDRRQRLDSMNATVVGAIEAVDDVFIAFNSNVNRDVPSRSIVLGGRCKIVPRENVTEGSVNRKVQLG